MGEPAYRIVTALVVHRMDAWGPATVSAVLALIVHDTVTLRTVVLACAIGVLYCFGYSVNDFCDASRDAKDTDKAVTNPFVRQRECPGSLRVMAVVVMAVLLAVFATLGARSLALFSVACVGMWAYSVPPLRLKSRPGFDLVIHAVFILTFPYLFVRILIDQPWSFADLVLLGLGFIASLGGQLSQQIRDFDLDVSTDRNFTTTYGLGTSILWLRATTVCTITIIVAGFIAGALPRVGLPLGVVCLPVLARRLAARPNRKPPPWLYGGLTMASLVYSCAMVWTAMR